MNFLNYYYYKKPSLSIEEKINIIVDFLSDKEFIELLENKYNHRYIRLQKYISKIRNNLAHCTEDENARDKILQKYVHYVYKAMKYIHQQIEKSNGKQNFDKKAYAGIISSRSENEIIERIVLKYFEESTEFLNREIDLCDSFRYHHFGWLKNHIDDISNILKSGLIKYEDSEKISYLNLHENESPYRKFIELKEIRGRAPNHYSLKAA